MRIISWNIQHGGGTRVADILRCIAGYEPDVLVLVEFRQGKGGRAIRSALAHLGMTERTVASAGSMQNSVLIASRQPFSALELPGIVEGEAPRVIGARFDDLDVFGFYFANGEKKTPLWQSLVAATPALLSRPVLMVGDFAIGRTRKAQHFGAPNTSRRRLPPGWLMAGGIFTATRRSGRGLATAETASARTTRSFLLRYWDDSRQSNTRTLSATAASPITRWQSLSCRRARFDSR